jgi:signal transduction histidine kinase
MPWFSRSSVRFRIHRRQPVRAKRHRICLPLQYRPATNGRSSLPASLAIGREWYPGRVRDISATGALLELTAGGLQPGDLLELRLSLPAQWVGSATVPVLCRARVVRLEIGQEGGMRVAVALQQGALAAEAAPTEITPPLPDIQHTVNNLLTSIVGTSELLLLTDGIDSVKRTQITTIRDFALRAASELQRLKSPAA